jgi:hypothetical protein
MNKGFPASCYLGTNKLSVFSFLTSAWCGNLSTPKPPYVRVLYAPFVST